MQRNNFATIQWKKEKEYCEYWILLKLECSTNAAYHSNAISNALESMLLGTSLFNDLDKAINNDTAHASRSSYTNLRKFYLSTSAWVSVQIDESVLKKMKQDTSELVCDME